MGNSSEKIEKYFKKTINSTMNNNKNSYIEDIEELFIRENVSSNKGIFSILLEAIKFSASDIHIEALTDKIRIRYKIRRRENFHGLGHHSRRHDPLGLDSHRHTCFKRRRSCTLPSTAAADTPWCSCRSSICILYRFSSPASRSTSLPGEKRRICRHSSEPMDPPAPVIKTVFPVR